ncbi:uncharacterized protein [Acropora muricata]|uniref:uncharacterized protein isoform X2 n=1 Tax=Acropora muricata TaxID=159855 RepID=UPI0034E3DD92
MEILLEKKINPHSAMTFSEEKGKKGGYSSDSKRDIGATGELFPHKYPKSNEDQACKSNTHQEIECHNNCNGYHDAMADKKQTEKSKEQRRVLEILGLTTDFLDDLEELAPEHYYHRLLCEWIVKSMEESIECLDPTDNNHLTQLLLQSIGFDPTSKAVETMLKRSASAKSTQNHIEASEWPKIFVVDEFKYNPFLSPSLDRFPFKSSLTDKWFHLDPEETKESENNYDHISRINVMNVTTKERLDENIRDIVVRDDPKRMFLFHGTDHQSASNILATRGIYLNAGRLKRDFSHGKGFYLSKSMDNALEWANCTTAKPAILIFRTDRRLLDSAKKLSLFDNEKRWHEIVHSFRSGRKTANTRESLSAYDFIEGAMATVRIDEDSDELVVEQKPSTYQMCLISTRHLQSMRLLFFTAY